MIKNDRVIISAVLKLTDNYHDELTLGYNPSSLLLIKNIHDVQKAIPLRISEEDAEESVNRLIKEGFLRTATKWNGGFSFCMTSRLKYRHAFWWDSFTKRYIAGFISGVAVTVVADLIVHFIKSLI